MKIAIDTQTTTGQKTGFGFYVQNLTSNIKALDKTNKYYFLKPQSSDDFSAPKRFVWDQYHIPRLAQRNKVDILHQPCFSVPLFYKGKTVVTIHDLIAIKFGKDIPYFSRMYFSRWMPYTYKKASAIISISENTKRDILRYCNLDKDKIFVIPSAASRDYSFLPDKEKIHKTKQKYHISGKYLLHIGTLNPRKNLLFLIDVFRQVLKKNPSYQLVIVGKEGWYYQQLYDKVRKYNIQDKVVFTGYIDEADKVYLYNGASLFVFPSIYEGFGLPPLEAMNCKVPVVSSNTSSMPEVIKDAGILLSPHDKKGWIYAINRVLSDSKLKFKLSELALQRASAFSWEKCAKKTIQVYEEVYRQ